MALSSEDKIIKEGETEKQGFSVTFTNGTLAQLEELKEFFKKADKLDVIKLAISILQNAKEAQEKKPAPTTPPK